MATATNAQLIAGLYTAFFDRAPDQSGLQYWENAFSGEATIADLAGQFAEHPVFTETYAGQTDEQFVQAIYQNVLGAAGEASGVAYWVDQLSAGVSRADMVASFVNDALTLDLSEFTDLSAEELAVAQARQDALTNKVNVGLHFVEKFGAASNLSADTDTTTKAGLEADPVYLASQAAIAGVTADAASVAAANAAIDAAASPADLNEGEAFTLTSGLEALDAANQAKAEFLAGLELDLNDDGTAEIEAGKATEDNVAADLSFAVNAVDALVDAGLTSAAAGAYANASANVKAALLADLNDANAKTLSDAQKALATAEAEIAKVTGLAQAAANLQSAEDALTAAEGAEKTAEAAQAGAKTAYETLHGGTITIEADGEVDGLIVELANGELQLVSGVTEAKNEGVTALLAAIKTQLAAEDAVANALEARDVAQGVVNNLDLTPDAVDALEAVAEAMTVVELAEGALPSVQQMQTEIAGLQALATTAQATADQTNAIALRATANNTLNLQTTADLTDAVALRAAADAAQTLADQTDALALRADAVSAEQAFQTAGGDPVVNVDEYNAWQQADQTATAAEQDDNDAQLADQAATAAEADDAAALAAGDYAAQNAAATAAEAADAAALAASQAVTSFQNLVTAYQTEALDNDRVGDLISAQQGVENAQDGIDALTEALANLAAAQANADQLETLNDSIAAAEKAFTDNGFEVPVTVDGDELATADADIFMVGEAGGSITNFGLLGGDVLFVAGATYNSAVIGSDDGEVALKDAGNNSVLEFFLEETATGVKVMVETSVFGSSAAEEEVTTIELSGLKLADLSVEGGFIALA